MLRLSKQLSVQTNNIGICKIVPGTALISFINSKRKKIFSLAFYIPRDRINSTEVISDYVK